jgi:hypothetical protein
VLEPTLVPKVYFVRKGTLHFKHLKNSIGRITAIPVSRVEFPLETNPPSTGDLVTGSLQPVKNGTVHYKDVPGPNR